MYIKYEDKRASKQQTATISTAFQQQYKIAWFLIHAFLYEIYSLSFSRTCRFLLLILRLLLLMALSLCSCCCWLNGWMNEWKIFEKFYVIVSISFTLCCCVYIRLNKHEVSSLNFILCSVCYKCVCMYVCLCACIRGTFAIYCFVVFVTCNTVSKYS